MATIWNFDPNRSLPNVTQVTLPKMFQIIATWLQFSTEEYKLCFIKRVGLLLQSDHLIKLKFLIDRKKLKGFRILVLFSTRTIVIESEDMLGSRK